MNQQVFITTKANQTKKRGKDLGQKILKQIDQADQAIVLGFEGDLGSGKTTFIQGLGLGLGVIDKITSPTFVLLKRYPYVIY